MGGRGYPQSSWEGSFIGLCFTPAVTQQPVRQAAEDDISYKPILSIYIRVLSLEGYLSLLHLLTKTSFSRSTTRSRYSLLSCRYLIAVCCNDSPQQDRKKSAKNFLKNSHFKCTFRFKYSYLNRAFWRRQNSTYQVVFIPKKFHLSANV